MPKTEIDYSNTIFYKISCKCEDNNELYVGHTTNFVQRKSAHKNSCNNPKSLSYPLKLYKTIRECGGRNNWNMEIIAFHKCADSRDARKTEQEYYEKLGATLNSIQPLPPAKIPILTEPHRIHTTDNINGAFKYRCDKCDFNCIKKYDYERHLSTRKHKKIYEDKENGEFVGTPRHSCHCGNVYKHLSGLYRHKKVCILGNTDKTPGDKYDMLSNTIMILVEENQEFRKLLADQNEKMMEMCKTLIIK